MYRNETQNILITVIDCGQEWVKILFTTILTFISPIRLRQIDINLPHSLNFMWVAMMVHNLKFGLQENKEYEYLIFMNIFPLLT